MIKCPWPNCGGWISEGYCVKCGRSANLLYEIGIRNKQREVKEKNLEYGPLFMGDGHEPGYQKKPRISSGANKRKFRQIKVRKRNELRRYVAKL